MTQTDPNAPKAADIVEELQLAGEQLLGKIKEIVREGNVRRIRVKQDNHVVLEIPLVLGFAGVLLAPTLAAIGAIGALLAQCSIEVVRVERSSAPSQPEQPSEGSSEE